MLDHGSDMKALSERLTTICTSYPTVHPQMIGEVVRAVIEILGSELSPQQAELLNEVEELGRTIAIAKQEIAALGSDTTANRDVSAASEELDAVVSHTADATNAILEACELLDETSARAGGPDSAVVQDATMRIYEACSFQDITGQRITKVVNTLKVVEARVNKIVRTFGQLRWEEALPPVCLEERPDAHLLNGPQLPAAAMDQADIDALLADF